MHDRRTLHLGRLLLTVPADAELREFSATINGVELEELELGDRSPEAGYLAWMQVSEQARETSGFDEIELDERSWIALYGISEPRVVALQQRGEFALVLGASTTEHEDAVPRVHALRQLYARSTAEPAGAFGLGHGVLELPPEHPEEFVATLSRGDDWVLTLSACAVTVPSPPDYEGLRAGLLAAASPERAPYVHAAERSCGSLPGEELFLELVDEAAPAFQATWRTPGRARDPAHPEVELELSIRGVRREAAEEHWRLIVESLRLASEALA